MEGCYSGIVGKLPSEPQRPFVRYRIKENDVTIERALVIALLAIIVVWFASRLL